jgi:hypothetical protein
MLGLAHRPKLDRKKKIRLSTAVVSSLPGGRSRGLYSDGHTFSFDAILDPLFPWSHVVWKGEYPNIFYDNTQSHFFVYLQRSEPIPYSRPHSKEVTLSRSI